MIAEITTWFWLGAIGMAAGTAVFVWGGIVEGEETVKYYATLTAISGIAAVAYLLMALEIGWTVVDGRTVFIPRYIDWLLTTPLLLLYLAMLVEADRLTIGKLIAANVVMIVAGMVAALLSGPERFGLFMLGAIAFLVVVYYLIGPLTDRASGRATESLYYSLRNLTVVLWAVYPVIWLLGPPGLDLMTELVDVVLITYLDLITKVGFGLIALNASSVLLEEVGAELGEEVVAD